MPDPGSGSRGAGRGLFVGVVGTGTALAPEVEGVAEEVGRRLAAVGSVLVCGGLGGVMAAACRGAASAGGTTVGILPGEDRHEANRWVTVPVATGLGELRNALVVRASDALVAVGGGAGTLSEIALALKLGRPVVGLGTWRLGRPDGSEEPGLVVARTAAEAVDEALALARSVRPAGGR